MADNSTLFRKVDTTSNPAPIGLVGFGMALVLLSIHNVGIYPLDSLMMGIALFAGGIGQIHAGFMEWKKGNTFYSTTFYAYGFFWLSLFVVWFFPRLGFGEEVSSRSTGFFYLLWGIFTLGMFFGTLKINRVLQFFFLTLALLFFLLAVRDLADSRIIRIIAGWDGIICGLGAIYAALAQVLNELNGKTVLPLGEVK